jgi:anti-sigma-K factor RskA
VSDPTASGTHAGCGANAAPYVLGALTDEEHRAFVAHLDSCVVCREEVTELQMVADALPAAAPQLKAPRALRAKVMENLTAEPDARAAPGGDARSARRRRAGRRRARGGWLVHRPLPALAGLTAALAIALALLALVGTGGGSARVIHAQVLARGASASLHLSGGHAVLDVSGMPQSAPRRVYEVWVKRAGAPQPTDALFTVTRSGEASVGVPGSLAGVKTVMVTSEPLGGSRVPTTPAVIVANLG